jgi:GPH family glycoside/pentoside/hexuronide:cation symporter
MKDDQILHQKASHLVPRPPLSQMLIYASGQLGWSLTIFGPTSLLIYFYLPPENNGVSLFPVYLPTLVIFGFLTIIGLLSFMGRVVDAISDPIVAGLSDNFQSRFGKRKTFFGMAVIPFIVSTLLIFFPPFEPQSTYNIVWLAGMLIVFYLSFTCYVIPYSALISELGHHPKDRLVISSLISAAWAIGIISGSSLYALQHHFQHTMTPVEAFQLSLFILVMIASVFMVIPVFFLKEIKYTLQLSQAISFRSSLRLVLKNSNFKRYIFSDLMYWLSITFIQTGLSYYITLIFGYDIQYATIFLAIAFIGSFLFYAPVNILVNRFGKKKILSGAFLGTAIVFLSLFMVDILPLPRMFLFVFIAALVSLPLACFGIIPNALIADIIHIEEHKTGVNQSGMYYAVRNFMMKMGISVGNLLFPSLLIFGKSETDYTGVKLTVLVAIVICISGFLIFTRFKEIPSIE